MAQAQLTHDTFVLSKFLSLRVLDNTQVEFTVTPANEKMPKTKMTISNAAWVSLSDKGIPKILELMDSDMEDSWVYHSKTKMITLSKKFMGWEILFQTCTSRGHPMREHNVYISESEWDELLKYLPLINGKISEIQLSSEMLPRRKR